MTEPPPKSDSQRFVLLCKDNSCNFRIRASGMKKGIRVTIKNPHTCTPTTHYNFKPSHSMWYLKSHHRSSVINNRNITPGQIQSDERLQFSNEINY